MGLCRPSIRYCRLVESVAADESRPDRLTEETFAELANFAEELTARTAAVVVGRMPNDYPFIEITPHLAGARAMRLIADQWVILGIDDGEGGRWELDYTDDGVAFARNALEAVVQGRVKERVVFGRSEITLTFADGSVHSATRYRGPLATLVPLPGWRRWGEARAALPYSA